MSDTWSYDPGYRPDDARHGLSPAELQRFYLARPPQWNIRCTYGPDGLAKREGALKAHVSYLSARKDRIYFVGPILADDGLTPIGSFLMIDAPDRASAQTFIEGEGFYQAGMLSEVEIKRFVETSHETRRQAAMTPDPGKQLYLVELVDGPDGSEIRKQTGPAHHAYQKQIMDRFLAHGPIRSDDSSKVIGTLLIIAADNRADAEALVANEPMVKAGVFSEIRVQRWRFGKSIA